MLKVLATKRLNRSFYSNIIIALLLSVLSIWVISGIAHVYREPNLIDDSYITLTYARSLAQGYGFRSHPDAETSLGTTTPLFAMAIAVAQILFPLEDMRVWPIAISTLAWIATAWLWAFKGEIMQVPRLVGVAIGVILLIEPSRTWVIHISFEARFFALLLTLALFAYFSQRLVLAGMIVAASVLSRPEGILLLPALAIYELFSVNPQSDSTLRIFIKPTRKLLYLIGGFASVMVVWAVIAMASIGYILPTTITAKATQGTSGYWARTAFETIISLFRQDAEWGANKLGVIQLTQTVTLSWWGVLSLCGVGYAALFHRRMLSLVLFGVLQTFFYGFFNIPDYTWYLLPIVYIMLTFGAIFITAPIIELLTRIGNQFKINHMQIVAYPILALLLVFIATKTMPLAFDLNSQGMLFKEYQLLGRWLNKHIEEDKSVAYVEVGYIAWFSERHIIDLLGLITPSALAEVKDGMNTGGMIERLQPDYFIYVPKFTYFLGKILNSSFVKHNYIPVNQLSSPLQIPNSTYTIYKKTVGPSETQQDFVVNWNDQDVSFSGLRDVNVAPNAEFSATTVIDPTLAVQSISLCAADYSYITLEVRAPSNTKLHILQMFFMRDGDDGFSEERSIKLDYMPGDYWQPVTIPTAIFGTGWGDLDNQSSGPKDNLWQGVITGIRFDPVAESDTRIFIRNWRLIRSENEMSACDTLSTQVAP